MSDRLRPAKTLETPLDFKEYIERTYTPARQVDLHVELVDELHDWKAFLAPLDVHCSGLFDEERRAAGAAHCFKFIQARDINYHELPDAELTNLNPAWEDAPREPTDAVLLAKGQIHSKSLSQKPVLALPSSVASLADWSEVPTRPRNKLLGHACQNFLRTADRLRAEPWNLNRSAAWLEQWVARGRAGHLGRPCAIPEFLRVGLASQLEQSSAVASRSFKDFAPNRISNVQFGPVPKKRKKALAPPVCVELPPEVVEEGSDAHHGPAGGWTSTFFLNGFKSKSRPGTFPLALWDSDKLGCKGCKGATRGCYTCRMRAIKTWAQDTGAHVAYDFKRGAAAKKAAASKSAVFNSDPLKGAVMHGDLVAGGG